MPDNFAAQYREDAAFQFSYYGYHVGQIVFLAKHCKGGDWQPLSIPRDLFSQRSER